MANEEHLQILLKEGVEAWNQWRKQNPKIRPELSVASLIEATLTGVHFGWANLISANLSGADLSGADLSGADLRDAHLDEANLTGAHLSWANLTSADLRGAELCGADLTSANLKRANFSRTDLRGANFTKTELAWVDLNMADLTKANLRGAILNGTNLSGAVLSSADFGQAILDNAVFADVDLSQAQGLETVQHRGPSEISIRTIYRSQGNIPEVFLRGAGVPDPFIANIKSLMATMSPIELYSCFISYSSQDQEFAERFYTDLQANGVRCWYAPHDIQAGKKLHEQIDRAIRVYERVLLILSADSMSSPWVKTEISKAREREVREKKQVLFPIRLVDFEVIRRWECFDADTGIDSAKEIREYFIPDFSNWKKHDSYEQAFLGLLRDLQGEKTQEGAAS
ncbi:MAG TPA: toll/interleukin-1 receptor domain-containing protein [Candidatus Angelobacter sp.]|jgi:hypothetical protein|nr:toll/interleukin-1 receptor domain-containing protein [Candidatus Angelobacter sp.]